MEFPCWCFFLGKKVKQYLLGVHQILSSLEFYRIKNIFWQCKKIWENFSLSSLDLFSGKPLEFNGIWICFASNEVTLIKLRRQGCHRCLMWILKFHLNQIWKFYNKIFNLLLEIFREAICIWKCFNCLDIFAHVCERVLRVRSTVTAISGWVGVVWVDLLAGC